MKRIPRRIPKTVRMDKNIRHGTGMVVISWRTLFSVDTGSGEFSGRFSPRTQPTHRITADHQNDGTIILLACGGTGGSRGGGKGGGSGQCDGSGSG